MKVFELHNQPVEADTYEASMALNQLLKIGKHAIKIHNMIDDSAEMEAWVAKKIDLAGDYVKKVHGYMQGEKAGLYDDGGMTENAGDEAMAKEIAKIYDNVVAYIQDVSDNPADDQGDLRWGYDSDDVNDAEDLAAAFRKDLNTGMSLQKQLQAKREKEGEGRVDVWDPFDPESIHHNQLKALMSNNKGESAVQEDAGEKIANMAQNMTKDEFMSNADELGLTPEEAAEYYAKMQGGAHAGKFNEDAGEGHMSKSTLYHTAKYAIELMQMIRKGDDLEGWVQSKLNKAADYLQGVHNYEEYQKLNPYREELDSSILQRHAGIVQKHIDEILARETSLDDVDTKPGMMRILAKRVNEVEKEIAKEQRKDTDEEAPPGREKQVKALKKKFKDKGAPYAIAWAQHNKHGKPKNEAELEEGLKDWARNLAMAGVVVAGLAGVGSINDAINNSVPAVKAMNTAYEMAVDQGQTELANQIKKDLSAVKVRLDSGRDLNFVKDMQDKYSKFMKTEGLAYESKLAVMLDQRIK